MSYDTRGLSAAKSSIGVFGTGETSILYRAGFGCGLKGGLVP